MSSSLYFLAKSMNPFIGLFGLSGSFSLGVLGALVVVVGVAGEAGGDPDPEPYTMLFLMAALMATGLTKVVAEDAAASEAEGVVGSGTVSEPAVPAGSENWNRRNRSLRSGVLTTSA